MTPRLTRTFLLLLGLTLLFLSAFGLAASGQETEPVPQPQCVQVAVKDSPRTGSLGTGAYIGPRLVVTANHVVKDRQNDLAIEIRFPVALAESLLIKSDVVYMDKPFTNHIVLLPAEGQDRQSSSSYPNWEAVKGKVIYTDRAQDLALIELLSDAPCQPLGLNTDDLEDGTALSVQGYGGGKYKQSWGTLSSTRLSSKWRKVSNARSVSGDSGGPVLDADGRYAGTLWGSVGGATYFTSADIVTEAVLGLGIDLPEPVPTPNNDPNNDDPDDEDFRIYGPDFVIPLKFTGRYHRRTKTKDFFRRVKRRPRSTMTMEIMLAGRYHNRTRTEKFYRRVA